MERPHRSSAGIPSPDRPLRIALADVQWLQLPAQALLVQRWLSIELDKRSGADLHWYIDAGVCGTGLTVVHELESPTAQRPSGVVRSHNRWLLPDEPGELRVWVVANRRKGPNANMSWRQAVLVVD